VQYHLYLHFHLEGSQESARLPRTAPEVKSFEKSLQLAKRRASAYPAYEIGGKVP